jgi:(4-O-methyl)-D-glucuronate---lignin esterase
MGATEHDYGKGKIYWGRPPEEVLAGEKVSRDFEYNRPEFDSELVWIHRRDRDTDIYFVANQKERSEDVKTSFRVEGKEAELWHPDTGIDRAGRVQDRKRAHQGAAESRSRRFGVRGVPQ